MLSRRPVALLAALLGTQAVTSRAVEGSCAASSMLQIGRDRTSVTEVSNNVEGSSLTEDVQGYSSLSANHSCEGANCAPPRLCLVWGDPHVVGFDGGQDWKIMKSSIIAGVRCRDIHIHFFACNEVGSLEGVKVNGRLLDNHVLRFWSTGYRKRVRVTWDDKEILRHRGSSWRMRLRHGVVEGAYLDEITPEPEEYKVTNYKHLLDQKIELGHQHRFRLPNDMVIYVANPFEMSVVIKMKKVQGQEGVCGNFDGNPHNDKLATVAQRMGGLKNVILASCPSHTLPFPYPNRNTGLLLLNDSNTAQKDPLPSYCDSTEAGVKFKKEVLTACKLVKEELFYKSCVDDACATGSLNTPYDEIAEEFMKSEAEHLD